MESCRPAQDFKEPHVEAKPDAHIKSKTILAVQVSISTAEVTAF